MRRVRVRPAPGPLAGALGLPGDKSIAHRAVLLGALATGTQRIRGLPQGADVRASLAAVAALGARVEPDADWTLVHGAGRRFGAVGPEVIDCANSGTTMRLLAGMLAGGSRTVVLDGDASLRRRPMERVAAPLRALGARVETTAGRPPIRIHPGTLRGIDWTLPVASAQVKSAILLAGLGAAGETVVREPHPTRDHTERMLVAMGVPVERRDGAVAVRGGTELHAIDLTLPGDPSSAAFFAVAAAIVPGSRVVLRDVCVNPTRDGFVRILRRMGAAIEYRNARDVGGEPCADVCAAAGVLVGTSIDAAEVPAAVDELPVLAIAAACAAGETQVRGASELRVKESDRLEALAQLRVLGVDVTVVPDGLVVRGTGGGPLGSGAVSARGDHRIAMAFAVAALRAPDGIEIDDAGAVDVSFPGFFDRLSVLGAQVEVLA
ncbi:MAG TPA: 3-phosphoshikimate 1-carboxyvinyltransferase [Candidatus Limnocylindria bacterium]|nr:3-phosphoshikimate 1-carboxyvinyltransferase [Candidatus Limnocylindria bacterium]